MEPKSNNACAIDQNFPTLTKPGIVSSNFLRKDT